MNSEKNTYLIEFKNNEIFIERTSETKTAININFFGEKKDFNYEIDSFKQCFTVLGEEFQIDEKDKILMFSYRLFDSNENEINKIKISLKF